MANFITNVLGAAKKYLLMSSAATAGILPEAATEGLSKLGGNMAKDMPSLITASNATEGISRAMGLAPKYINDIDSLSNLVSESLPKARMADMDRFFQIMLDGRLNALSDGLPGAEPIIKDFTSGIENVYNQFKGSFSNYDEALKNYGSMNTDAAYVMGGTGRGLKLGLGFDAPIQENSVRNLWNSVTNPKNLPLDQLDPETASLYKTLGFDLPPKDLIGPPLPESMAAERSFIGPPLSEEMLDRRNFIGPPIGYNPRYGPDFIGPPRPVSTPASEIPPSTEGAASSVRPPMPKENPSSTVPSDAPPFEEPLKGNEYGGTIPPGGEIPSVTTSSSGVLTPEERFIGPPAPQSVIDERNFIGPPMPESMAAERSFIGPPLPNASEVPDVVDDAVNQATGGKTSRIKRFARGARNKMSDAAYAVTHPLDLVTKPNSSYSEKMFPRMANAGGAGLAMAGLGAGVLAVEGFKAANRRKLGYVSYMDGPARMVSTGTNVAPQIRTASNGDENRYNAMASSIKSNSLYNQIDDFGATGNIVFALHNSR